MCITHLPFKEKMYFQINKSRPDGTSLLQSNDFGSQKRKWLIVNRYCLCKVGKVPTNHILFHCDRVRKLWDIISHSLSIFRFCERAPFGMEGEGLG